MSTATSTRPSHASAVARAEADDVFEDDDFTADFCFSIGGDGTFLRTARRVGEKEIPILGFNTGHLGFLAEHSITEAPAMVERLLAGDYTVESRSLLEGKGIGGKVKAGVSGWGFALNEIAILRQDTASMITVNTLLDGMPVASYQGDGLVVSTPTGSTAYNLSVGGPRGPPTAPCWVLSPIAPHSLTMRPLVVADSHMVDHLRRIAHRHSTASPSTAAPSSFPSTSACASAAPASSPR